MSILPCHHVSVGIVIAGHARPHVHVTAVPLRCMYGAIAIVYFITPFIHCSRRMSVITNMANHDCHQGHVFTAVLMRRRRGAVAVIYFIHHGNHDYIYYCNHDCVMMVIFSVQDFRPHNRLSGGSVPCARADNMRSARAVPMTRWTSGHVCTHLCLHVSAGEGGANIPCMRRPQRTEPTAFPVSCTLFRACTFLHARSAAHTIAFRACARLGRDRGRLYPVGYDMR